MTLLIILSSLLGLSYSVTYPTVSERFQIVVDQCINNVTFNGADYDNEGSVMCHCSDYSVVCTAYEENGCSGEPANFQSWGGCDQSSPFGTKYMYRVDNCSDAQAAAAQGECNYFVDDETISGGSWNDFEEAVKSLDTCLDYNCGGSNSDENSKSCIYRVDGNNITYREFDDYTCSHEEFYNPNYAYLQRSDTGNNCAVTVTKYQIANSDYYCGSPDSKWSANARSSPNKNYILLNYASNPPDSTPTPIGQCLRQRNGFHTYSEMLQCHNNGDVGRWIYLSSGSCSGDSYLVQNYSKEDYFIECGYTDGSGYVGEFTQTCNSPNPHADYVETGELFNQCVQFRNSPNETTAGDGSLYQNQPWNRDLRIVRGCSFKGKYRVHYFYTQADCSGDYLFRFDEGGWLDEYESTSDYSSCPARRLDISGCSNCPADGNKNHLAS